MGLSHVRIQEYASVVECYALLVVAHLVIYGTNQQQHISLVGVYKIHLQGWVISQATLAREMRVCVIGIREHAGQQIVLHGACMMLSNECMHDSLSCMHARKHARLCCCTA